MLALSTLAGVQAEFNFEELLWEVYLVEAAQQKLRQLDNTLKEKAFRALKELAEGTWKQCRIVSKTEKNKIRCRKLEENTHLLWMVDLAYSPSKKMYREVVQVWDVVLIDDDLDELASKIVEQLRSMKNRQFLQSPPGRDGPGSEEMKHKPRTMPQAYVESKNMAGVTSARKFFRIDTSIVAGLLHSEGMVYLGNRPVAMQFEMQVSKEEHELITREGPLLVLGKSGSGKTLTAVYRMVARYQEYWEQCLDACGEPQIRDASSQWNHFNQVFVTHSQGLVKKVSEYFNNHLESRAGAIKPSQILKAVKDAGVEIPADLSKVPDDIRKVVLFPIFCTYREFLIMIDGQCEQPFFPRALDGSLDEAGVAMLGGDGHKWMQTHHSRHSIVLTEVDDASFDRYWGGFRKEHRKLDPALVWKEIQTHIKGSYKILDGRPTGFLTEEEYVHIGKKLSPGLDGLRHDIYRIFEAYEDMKNGSHRFDRQDAAFHIVSQLRNGGYHGPPIHSATVDEVQDLSQVELALFLYTTPHTHEKYEGLFLAGDTTQTVSRSIDCRFCDIQSLFHSCDCRVPRIDKLTRNYRTHHEILALSNNVSAHIERAFPYSIDRLAPDYGQDAGPMPMIVTGQPSMGLAPGLQSDDTEGLLAFGAMQCIIVRKQESKEQVPAALRNGLLLTVEESKGLEFDDVILLNFFKDCRCDAGIWEALLKSTVPLHDNFSFAALCNELKRLYTGITRTIRTLVCIEEDNATCAMFDHWLQEGLVVERRLGDVATLLAQQSRASDTPHQWASQGRLLFQRSLYTNARVCFQRAGDDHMVQVCDAHALAAAAQHTIAANEAEGKQMFSRAAVQFGDLGMRLERAGCLRGACMWIQAAVEFGALGSTRMLDAAQCYEEADEWRSAADCYMAATPRRDYIRAVRALDRSHAAEDERMLHAIAREGHSGKELTAVALDDTLKRHGGVKVSAELFHAEHLWGEAAERYEEAARLAGEDTEESDDNTEESDDNLEAAADCWVKSGNDISAARAVAKAMRATSRLRAIDLFIDHIKNHKQCEADCKTWLKETGTLLRGNWTEGIQSEVEQRVTECVALLEELDMHMDAGDLQAFYDMKSEADSAYLRALSYYARLCREDDSNFDQHHSRRLVDDLVDRLEMTTSSCKDAADICTYLAKHEQAARFYGRADCRLSQAESLERGKAFKEALDLVRALSHSEREVDLRKAFKIESSCLYLLGQRLESARIDVRHLLPSQQEQSERSVELLSILKEKVALEAFANFVDSEVLNTAEDNETIAKAFIDKVQTEGRAQPAVALNTLRRLFRDPYHARVPSRPLTRKLHEVEAGCCEKLGNPMEAVRIYMLHLLPEHVETVLRLVPANDIRDFVQENKDALEKHPDLLAAAYRRKAVEEFNGQSYEIALSIAQSWRDVLGQLRNANAAWFQWKASHKLEVDCRVQLRQPEENIARSISGRFEILMETTRNHSSRKLSEQTWLVPLLSAWTKNRSSWRSELDECMRLVPLSAWKMCIKHLQDCKEMEAWSSQQRVILEKVKSVAEVEGRWVALEYLENTDYVALERRTCQDAVSLWQQLVMGRDRDALSGSLWNLLACVPADMDHMLVEDAVHLTRAVVEMLPEIELENAREMLTEYPQVLSCTAGFDVAVQLLMDKVHHRDAITPQHCALILMGLRCGDVRDSVHCVLRSEAARMLMDCLQHSDLVIESDERDAMIDRAFQLTCEPHELFRKNHKEVNNMVYVWQYGADEHIIEKYRHRREPVLAAAVASMSGHHSRAVKILMGSNASNHSEFIKDVLVNAANSRHIEQEEARDLWIALHPEAKSAWPLQTWQMQLWRLALERARGLANEEDNALARKEEDLIYRKKEEEENVKKERSREATERARNEVQRWKDELKKVQTEIAEAMKICPMLQHEVRCTRDGYKGLLRQAKEFQATIQSGKWWEQKDALRRRIARLYGLRLPLYEALYNEVAEIAKELDVQLPPWEGTLVFAASHKLSQSSGGVWKSLTQEQLPVDKLLSKAIKDLMHFANQLLHTCANELPEVSGWRVWKLADEEVQECHTSHSREQKQKIDWEYKRALAAAFEVEDLREVEFRDLKACLDLCFKLKETHQRESLRKKMLARTTERPQHFVKLLRFLSETFASQDGNVACANWISPAAEEVTRALQVTTICMEAAIEARCSDHDFAIMDTLRSDLRSRLQRLLEECEDEEACALAKGVLARNGQR